MGVEASAAGVGWRYRASCLISKTPNVVGDVTEVATGHLAALFSQPAEEHPEREFLVLGFRLAAVHGLPAMFELPMRDPPCEECRPTTCRSELLVRSPVSSDAAPGIRWWCNVPVSRFAGVPERRMVTVGRGLRDSSFT